MFKDLDIRLVIGIAVAAFFSLIVICMSYYTVDQGERTLVLRFGSIIKVAEPGFHFKIPFIDHTIDMNIRTQKVSSKIEIYSKDTQAAIVVASLNYTLDPSKVSEIYSNFGPEYYTSVIEPKLRALPKQIFGTYTAENIVQKRDELSAMITKLFESVFEGTGIVPETYNVEDVKFSAEYERSIEDKMRASVEVEKSKQMLSTEKQRAEIKKTQADANAYQRKADADAEAHAITVKGAADAKAIIAKGDAEAQVIEHKSAVLSKNPTYIDFVKADSWDGKLPTTMVPGSTVPFINVK